MSTKVKVKKDKSAYKSYTEIAELARGRQEIKNEKFRSFIDRNSSGVYFAARVVQERLDALAKQAQVALGKQQPKQRIGEDGGRGMTASNFSTKVQTGDDGTQAELAIEGKFETWKNFSKDLFSDLTGSKPGLYQLGHKNLGVATAKAAVYLEQLPPDDPIRPQLRAYFLALKELDKITDTVLDPRATLDELLTTVSKLEKEQDRDVVTRFKQDVNMLQGKGDVKLEFEHELFEVNNSKAKVSKIIFSQISALLGDPDYNDVIAQTNLDFSRLKGSNSFSDTLTEEFINLAVTGKSRSVKVKSNSRVKKSKKAKLGVSDLKKKSTQALKKTQTSAKLASSVTRRPRGKGDAGLGSQQHDLQLFTLLKAKLPQTVAKNMGPPGLEYRTGQFAGSVTPTDVSRTAQGFPSVGYTYRKNPYQVFEMGAGDARWATPDRDPRKVIDLSIREIAAQLVVGRLYTRRQ